MEAKIFLLDEDFNLIKQVDDYISLIWCERFIEFSAVDLELPATIENIELYKIGRFLYRSDDRTICRINNREINTTEEKDDQLIIGAIDLLSITEQVTIYGKLDVTKQIPTLAWIADTLNKIFDGNILGFDGVTENAINKADYPNFKLQDGTVFIYNVEFVSDSYNFPLDDENAKLSEHIFHLLKKINVGWKILKNPTLAIWFYPGVDRSLSQSKNERILFSDDFENLQTSKFSESMEDMANVAVVLHNHGNVLGDNGLFHVSIHDEEPKGLNRFVIGVDGTKIELESSNVDHVTTFKEKLRALGLEELSKHAKKTKFESEVFSDEYKYRTDYNLGDIITVKNKYGIIADGRIVEVIETWDEEGYSIEPVFEYLETGIRIENALLTEASELLLTEANEYIIYI